MAIQDDTPGLEVVVCIDGKPLEEYDNDEEEEMKPGLDPEVMKYQAARTVTKYIESVSDQGFVIQINLGPPFKMDYACLSMDVHIDGNRVDSPLIVKSKRPQSFSGDYVTKTVKKRVEGMKVAAPGNTGRELLRKFKFAKIETTSDDHKLADLHEDMKRIHQVGEIAVHVYRGGVSIPEIDHVAKDLDGESVSEVHEKALKGQAKSHVTVLGPGSTVREKNWYRTKRLDGRDRPLAIFRFKYRSREALKSLLIIERTPSPEPAKTPAPEPGLSLDNLNPAQKTRLEQFLRELANEDTPNRIIKRERDDDGGSEGSRRKRRSVPPVTIDLTDD